MLCSRQENGILDEVDIEFQESARTGVFVLTAHARQRWKHSGDHAMHYALSL